MTAKFPIPDLKNIRSNKVGFYFHWILNSWWAHLGVEKVAPFEAEAVPSLFGYRANHLGIQTKNNKTWEICKMIDF